MTASATAAINRYLFVITNFDRDPDRTAIPLVLANTAASTGADVLVWLAHDGVLLAKKSGVGSIKPESFSAVSELLDNYSSAGGRIGVCPPCAKTRNVTESDLLTNAGWMGAAALLAEMQGRQTMTF